MNKPNRLTRERLAEVVASEIAPGSYVNIGLGLPTLVARYLDPAKEIVLHSENGILGLRDLSPGNTPDEDLINASKSHIELIQGSSICDQSLSFAMMRGGHLDATILGAFQVSEEGDLASWSTGDPEAVPGIGGAMDLVAGARRVLVVMEHVTREGKPRLLEKCRFPLTGCKVVTTVYTDMGIIDVVPGRGFVVRALAQGLEKDEIQAVSEAKLSFSDSIYYI